jgi:hypothetical protein
MIRLAFKEVGYPGMPCLGRGLPVSYADLHLFVRAEVDKVPCVAGMKGIIRAFQPAVPTPTGPQQLLDLGIAQAST